MCREITVKVHLKNCNFEKLQFFSVDLSLLYFLQVKNCNFSILEKKIKFQDIRFMYTVNFQFKEVFGTSKIFLKSNIIFETGLDIIIGIAQKI